MVDKKLSNTVKYTCDNCDHIERYTKRQAFNKKLSNTLKEVLILLGAVLLVAVIIIGPVAMITVFVSTGLTYSSKIDTNAMRLDVINMTTACDDNSATYSYCYAYQIYKNVSDVKYVPASHYNMLVSPDIVYRYGGDCKHLSMMFVSMMRSVGQEAYVHCNAEQAHCVALVPKVYNYERMDGYVIVDLTTPMYYEMQKGMAVWDYRELGVRYE